MSLLAAENATNLKSMVSKISGIIHTAVKCFQTNNFEMEIATATYRKSFDFWTSGANEGEYCDTEKVYSWCSNGKRVRKQDISVNWVDGTKEPTSAERCLTLKTKDADSSLAFTECGSKRSLLCEVRWQLAASSWLKNVKIKYCEFCISSRSVTRLPVPPVKST